MARSFAFVDLSGFTTFTDMHGDEEASKILGNFRSCVRTVCSRRGVRVAKWQGDGAMFVGVEPPALVETVLELENMIDRDSPLLLKAGMTCGHVILFEGDDYIGSAVNLASRLCDSAEPHEILTGTEMIEYIPRWATAEPAVPRQIRGFAHPVPVLRLHHRADGPLVHDPICGLSIPADAVGAWRDGGEGSAVAFCSDSCAIAWDEKTLLRR